MRAGRLDRLITIQRKSTAASDSGEPVESWENLVMRRPASMSPVRGDERFSGEQNVSNEQVEFRIFYSANLANLTPLDRIIHPALQADSPVAETEERRIYDILAVHEIGMREGLQIITSRRPDVLT